MVKIMEKWKLKKNYLYEKNPYTEKSIRKKIMAKIKGKLKHKKYWWKGENLPQIWQIHIEKKTKKIFVKIRAIFHLFTIIKYPYNLKKNL